MGGVVTSIDSESNSFRVPGELEIVKLRLVCRPKDYCGISS